MFARAFRVKSNTAIKGSDRRKLRADVTAAFPMLGADQVSELIPGKEELNIVKLYAHKGDTVTVYMSGGNPILFELEKSLCPTVYTLWSYPDLLPTFTTWPLVHEKLVGGADLMLPGLVVPPAGLPQVQKGDLCAIALVGNRAPIAIGVAAMSTDEMLASGLRGRGFSVLHTYQDYLWQSGDKSSPPAIAPLAVDPTDLSEEKVDLTLQGDLRNLALEGEEENGRAHRACGEQSLPEASEDTTSRTLNQESSDSKPLQEQMDELLQQCFLHALKSRVKKADLPLLTSTLFGSHMFSCCPEGKQLDIKKSSYKKLSKFLQHMQKEQIIEVKELSKGVESIVAVDWRHPKITTFIIPESSLTSQTVQEDSREQPYHPPDIKPLYCIPASMTQLFQGSGHKKGSTLEGSEVRKIIIDYAKRNNLVDAINKNLVNLDPILCDCILEKHEHHVVMKLPWDSLLTRCMESLQPAYQVTFPGQEPIVKKGKICPIDITLALRTYNKKVTVVRNLEVYGLDPCSVAAILQQQCQASTTVTPDPGTKDSMQVQIQGNQIHHLGKLLLGGKLKGHVPVHLEGRKRVKIAKLYPSAARCVINGLPQKASPDEIAQEEYRLPRKYIQGLEKAPKPGKKK